MVENSKISTIIEIVIVIIVFACIGEIAIRKVIDKDEDKNEEITQNYEEAVDWNSLSEEERIGKYIQEFIFEEDIEKVYNKLSDSYKQYKKFDYFEPNKTFKGYYISKIEYNKYLDNIYICEINLNNENTLSRIKNRTIDNLVIIEYEPGNYQVSLDGIIDGKYVGKSIDIDGISYYIDGIFQNVDGVICKIKISNQNSETYIINNDDIKLQIQRKNGILINRSLKQTDNLEIQRGENTEIDLIFEGQYEQDVFFRLLVKDESIAL